MQTGTHQAENPPDTSEENQRKQFSEVVENKLLLIAIVGYRFFNSNKSFLLSFRFLTLPN
jgi:hypothetical protein